MQAVKWIGGALFGDGEDVLDEIAERGDERPPAKRRIARRANEPRRVAAQRRLRPLPQPDVFIDVDEFVDEDEEDE